MDGVVLRDDPALAHLGKDELIGLLPPRVQQEVRRIEWAFKHIDDLAYGTNRDPSQVVIDPFSQRPVHEMGLSREQILLLFDPGLPEPLDGESDEDLLLRYVSSDKVVWARAMLGIEPRAYQKLFLRDPSTRQLLRWGRRCGKTTTFMIDMLYSSCEKPGHISMLVAPMKSQCEVVWNMVKQGAANPLVIERAGGKPRSKEYPYYMMTFPNGSVIKMFTSGVRSRGKGDTIRGQEADALYMDEFDLMGADDMKAISTIMRDTGRPFQKRLIIASTPNGRRDMMYQYSTRYRDPKETDYPFTEHYYPTHADVNYTPADDKEQKAMLSAVAYQHEVLALYGEETSGVFLKEHIERACAHAPGGYRYLSADDVPDRLPDQKIVVGVDWDKYGAGVNIVVVSARYGEKDEHDPFAGRAAPIARWEIPRGVDVLTRSIDFIKDINHRFAPDAIYVDRGFGDTQYEQLMLAAKEAEQGGGDLRCVGLADRLVGVHFAERITVMDPRTGEEAKKELKDYMVTVAIKMFEDDMIVLNENDYEQVPGPSDLIKQLEGYQVVRRTATGCPVYEAGSQLVGDHALDAFLLCLLALDQRWGKLNAARRQRPKAIAVAESAIPKEHANLKKDTVDDGDRRVEIRRTAALGRDLYLSSRSMSRIRRRRF